LSDAERESLVRGEIGSVYEIDGDMGALGRDEFEHLICEEISSETGWLVSSFAYTVIESEPERLQKLIEVDGCQTGY